MSLEIHVNEQMGKFPGWCVMIYEVQPGKYAPKLLIDAFPVRAFLHPKTTPDPNKDKELKDRATAYADKLADFLTKYGKIEIKKGWK